MFETRLEGEGRTKSQSVTQERLGKEIYKSEMNKINTMGYRVKAVWLSAPRGESSKTKSWLSERWCDHAGKVIEKKRRGVALTGSDLHCVVSSLGGTWRGVEKKMVVVRKGAGLEVREEIL